MSISRQAQFSFQQSCPDVLDQYEIIDDHATLIYSMVPPDPPWSGDNGLLCARLEVADHDGWVGLGFSRDGKMGGSDAIVGIPNEGSVLKYDLSDDWADPMPEERQTLGNVSIRSTLDGTVMEFTKLLAEEGEIEIAWDGANTFLHARGGDSFPEYHTTRLAFELNNAVPTWSPSFAPTKAPTGQPTAMPVTGSPTVQPSSSPVTEGPTATPTQTPTAAPTPKPTVESAAPAEGTSSAGTGPQYWKLHLATLIVAAMLWSF